ncbi:MAG: hypothetical protein NXI21_18545 [Alphaproteobacteria bacterium]|nr:hypothetical protein [Alphaproteobacteria bacterium]
MKRRIGLAALLLALLLGATACEQVKLRGQGGSSSDPEIDIGIEF